jgi:hypothetical protein
MCIRYTAEVLPRLIVSKKINIRSVFQLSFLTPSQKMQLNNVKFKAIPGL